MKRHLLFAFILIASGSLLTITAQQTITLKIIETAKDGDVSISFDDGEFEGDTLDKVNDDDLDMGWEGEDLFVMTAYTRFQNVLIPKGSVINSAKLKIYAHEDETAESYITVYAEDIDDSPIFSEDELIDDRSWTTTSVDWDITEDWIMWEPYESPDLSPVIQAIIDRPGWEAGNALTLFMQGKDQGASLLDNARDFESFENIEDPDDGGDGLHHPERIPTLEIIYTPPAGELILSIIGTDMDGETSVSFDDGEFEGDTLDKVNDDDLDMGWEGEDLFVMTAFTRFQNVTIPQGTTIDSAVLCIYAHEDETAPAYITIYAEAIDNSPKFSEDELINDRTWTTISLPWDITDDWTMWEPYHSPNLAAVIQEVINRPGWQSGNSLSLFLQGEDQGASLLDNARDFESYENIEDPDDGGDGLHHPERIPQLKIFWGGGSTVGISKKDYQSDAFRVFPNPVENGILNISSEETGNMQITIYSITGQLVRSLESSSSTMSMDLSDLHKGFYLVKTSCNKVSGIHKIVIK
jgi:hypothetical protein